MSAKRALFIVTAFLLVLHLAIDAAIVGWIRRVDDAPWLLLTTAAVPLAQATLVAAWAALSRIRSYLRIPLAVLALAWLWHVQCRSLGFDCRDDLSAAHALSLAMQGTLVFFVLSGVRASGWMLRRRGKLRDQTPPAQFSIGFLLCWTAAVALLLGLGRTALDKSGWTAEIVHDKMFFVGAVIGAYNAVIGLLSLGVLLGRRRWLLKAPGALLAIALLVLTEKPVLEYLFEFHWMVSTVEWYALAGFHLAYLTATLLPLRLCGGFSTLDASETGSGVV